jgi:uncharacterized protein (TIGR02246 family)
MKRSLQRATVAAVLIMSGAALRGQANMDPEFRKLADQYAEAWAKGDAKAIANLHTPDALQITGDGRLSVGRSAIELAASEGLSGPSKGSTLIITQGQSKAVSKDVYVGEGTYEVTGGTAPSKGRYLLTFVRQGDRWLIASSAAIMTLPAMPMK